MTNMFSLPFWIICLILVAIVVLILGMIGTLMITDLGIAGSLSGSVEVAVEAPDALVPRRDPRLQDSLGFENA